MSYATPTRYDATSAMLSRFTGEALQFAARNGGDASMAQAYEIGLITAELRKALAQLGQYEGTTTRPAPNCDHVIVKFGAMSVLVEYEFFPGKVEAADCPGYPDDVGIVRALVNGVWIDPNELFPDSTIDKWSAAILDGIATEAEDARTDRLVDALEDRELAA